MPAVIVFAALLAAVVVAGLAIFGLAGHLLFSPWLLVAVAIVAWIRFRPGRSRR